MPKIIKGVKGLMQNLLISLISVIVIIFLGEIFLRLNPDLIGIKQHSRWHQTSDPIGKTGTSKNGPFRASCLLGYEFMPNSQAGDTLINSYGLIGREYKLKKDKGIYRILLFGDSIAAQNWGRECLEKKLNSPPLINSKYQFEIWNAGVPSYDIRRYATYLKYKGIKYQPDMVMIFFCLNDFEPNTFVYYKDERGVVRFDFPFKELCNSYFYNPFLIRHSYFYRFAAVKFETYLANKKKTNDISSDERDGRFYLSIIKDICQRNNLHLLCVVFPYFKPLSKYASWERHQYNVMLKVLKDFNVSYVDLREYLSEKELYNLRQNKKDQIHPSQQGQCLIANILFDYLLENFFKT
jgi:lysophospholipase L1-like esterase